jgi:hypothetical protein
MRTRRGLAFTVMCVILLLLGQQVAMAQFTSITVSASFPAGVVSKYPVAAAQIPLKVGMGIGKPFVDENKVSAYPLANLDIVALDGSRRITIEKWIGDTKGQILVLVPLSYIIQVRGTPGASADTKLYTWDADKKIWVLMKTTFVKPDGGKDQDGFLFFRVDAWPIDDLVVACI